MIWWLTSILSLEMNDSLVSWYLLKEVVVSRYCVPVYSLSAEGTFALRKGVQACFANFVSVAADYHRGQVGCVVAVGTNGTGQSFSDGWTCRAWHPWASWAFHTGWKIILFTCLVKWRVYSVKLSSGSFGSKLRNTFFLCFKKSINIKGTMKAPFE